MERVPGSWQFQPHDQVYVGDFNGDGVDEVAIFNGVDWAIPYLGLLVSDGNGGLRLVARYDGDIPGWGGFARNDRFLVADLNGDGKDDLVFRHTDGRVHLRLMNGVSILTAGDALPAGTGWGVTQLLDLNGDGKKDLIFRHTDGSVTVRLMDGLSTIGSANLIGPGGWSIAPPQP